MSATGGAAAIRAERQGCGGTLGGLAMSSVWENVSPEAAFAGASLAAAAGCLFALACADRAAGSSEAKEPSR